MRHKVGGNDQDINHVISFLREAIEFTPANDTDYPAYLGNLEMELVARYKRQENRNDFDKAISLYQASLKFTPITNPTKPSRLNNLAPALYSKCIVGIPDLSVLDQIISLFRETVQLKSPTHSQRALYLNKLAEPLITRFAHCTPPITRFDMSKHWAKTATLYNCHDSALVAYSNAISLLHRITFVGLDVNFRKQRLELRSINLPCDAARCAIELRKYKDVVELLENGPFYNLATAVSTSDPFALPSGSCARDCG